MGVLDNVVKNAVADATKKAVAVASGGVGGVAGSLLGQLGNALAGTEYPDVGFRFAIEIDGLVQGLFSEIGGLEWEVTTESFHEGGINFHERHLLGPGKFTRLTMKRGFTSTGSEFLLWLKATYGMDKVKSRNVSIIVYNQQRTETGRFNIKNARIVKYSGPSFNSDNSAYAFEQVEMVYDFFEYQPAGLLNKIAGDALNAAAKILT